MAVGGNEPSESVLGIREFLDTLLADMCGPTLVPGSGP